VAGDHDTVLIAQDRVGEPEFPDGGDDLLDLPLRMGAGIARVRLEASCLIPDFDGAVSSREWKEALWDRFCMGAPARQRQCVERYNIVKRA
jgi:hypothetical protein